VSRGEAEEQLSYLTKAWPGCSEFMTSLQALDDDEYRNATANFRNLSSHAIAPRFNFGITSTVRRSVAPKTVLVPLPNGYFARQEQDKLGVEYAIGGVPPLRMRTAFELNLRQWNVAKTIFSAYVQLLDAALATLPLQSG